MNHSESLATIAPAICKMQAELQPAMKDTKNPFFKSSYADLSSIWAAASGPLANHGLAVIQTLHKADPVFVGEEVRHGVIVETILMHSSGEWISGECYYPLAKNDPQAVGSATTYGRRYGLQAILGIITEDDDGNAGSGNNSSFRNGETGHRTNAPSQNNQNRGNVAPMRQAPTQPQNAAPTHTGSPPAQSIDYLGTGVAKEHEAKLKTLCTRLNKAKVEYIMEDGQASLWNSSILDDYCQRSFDRALRDISKEEYTLMVKDLEDQLAERAAIQDEGSAPVGDAAAGEGGEAATTQQITALTKLSGIKQKDQGHLALGASSGRANTFAELLESEAAALLKSLSQM